MTIRTKVAGVIMETLSPRTPSTLAIPIFFGFTPDSRRSGVLDLEPTVSATGPIRRAEPLRHDALAPERASLTVDDRAVRDVKCALNAMPACLPRGSDFKVLLRVSIGSRRKSRRRVRSDRRHKEPRPY